MRSVGTIVIGLTALGLGYGAGSWKTLRGDRRDPDGGVPGKAVTYLGDQASAEGARQLDPKFASFSTFGEAETRLE